VFEHTFYVLEGILQVQLDTEIIHAGVGTSVFIPAGVVHTFANPYPQLARFLAIDAPAPTPAAVSKTTMMTMSRRFMGDPIVDWRMWCLQSRPLMPVVLPG
jgi:uncharacterized cupin superfamily protein